MKLGRALSLGRLSLRGLLTAWIVLLTGLTTSKAEARSWSLERCLEYALADNSRIIQAQISIERSEAALQNAKLDLLPSINLYLSHYLNWGRSVDLQELSIIKNRLTQQTTASVGASLTLFGGLRKQSEIRRNLEARAAGESSLKEARLETGAETIKAYLSVILAEQLLSSRRESLRTLETQVGKVRNKVLCGALQKASLLEIEARYSAEKMNATSAEAECRRACLNLIRVMGYDGDSILTDTCSLSKPVLRENEFDIESLMLFHPTLERLRHEMEMNRHALQSAKGLLLPSVTANASYGTYYSDAAEAAARRQFSENQNPSITLGLTVPILNGGTTISAIKKAELDFKESEQSYRFACQDVELLLTEVRDDCHTLWTKLEAATMDLNLNRENHRTALAMLDNGQRDVSAYLDAVSNLIESDQRYWEAHFNYILQLRLLEFYETEILGDCHTCGDSSGVALPNSLQPRKGNTD